MWRLIAALGLFKIAELGSWVAILLYAFDRGGVDEVGLLSIFLLLPSVPVAPIIAAAIDRYPQQRILVGGMALTTLSLGSIALAMYLNTSHLIVYALALTFSLMIPFGRPAIFAALTSAADTIETFTRGTVTLGIVSNTARLVGPPLASVIVAFWSPSAALGFASACLAVATLVVFRLPAVDRIHADDERTSPLRDVVDGSMLMLRNPQLRAIAAALFTAYFILGVFDVAIAPIAIDILDGDQATVGVLLAGFGAGTVFGAFGSLRVLRRFGAAYAIVGAGLLLCLAAAASAAWPTIWQTLLTLTVAGYGYSTIVTLGHTLVHGLTPTAEIGRVFGVVETLTSFGIAAGVGVVTFLNSFANFSIAVAVASGSIALVVLVCWPTLRTVENRRDPVNQTHWRLLNSSTIFSALPNLTVDSLVRRLAPAQVEAGGCIFSKGAPGESMAVVASGRAVVHLEGDQIDRTVGDYIGEIALVRSTPRTADVVAGPDGCELLWLDGATFLAAVANTPRSRARLVAEADRRAPISPTPHELHHRRL